MKKKGERFRWIALLAVALLLVLAAFLSYQYSQKKNNEPKSLGNVEIREYQGERLSSVDDFRENSIKGPQHVNISNYELKVNGMVEKSVSYKYDEVINKFGSYTKIVSLDCVEGWSVTILWQGFLASDLLKEAKPMQNADTVIFHAYDGYTTSFPLSYLADNNIIIAYKMNNITIPDERGFPFMLVAESKWGYKWIKWITEIELSNDSNYKGYWESRGYAKEGNLNESFFG